MNEKNLAGKINYLKTLPLEVKKRQEKSFEASDYECFALVGKEKKDIETYIRVIYKKAISLSKHHIARAGLTDYIKVERLPVADFFNSSQFGTIVTNAPYGERSLNQESVIDAYKDLKTSFSKLGDGWGLHLITSYQNFERVFGKRADKNRKLYNADKECKLYSYYPKNVK